MGPALGGGQLNTNIYNVESDHFSIFGLIWPRFPKTQTKSPNLEDLTDFWFFGKQNRAYPAFNSIFADRMG